MKPAEWTFFEPFIVGFRGFSGLFSNDHLRVVDSILLIGRAGA